MHNAQSPELASSAIRSNLIDRGLHQEPVLINILQVWLSPTIIELPILIIKTYFFPLWITMYNSIIRYFFSNSPTHIYTHTSSARSTHHARARGERTKPPSASTPYSLAIQPTITRVSSIRRTLRRWSGPDGSSCTRWFTACSGRPWSFQCHSVCWWWPSEEGDVSSYSKEPYFDDSIYRKTSKQSTYCHAWITWILRTPISRWHKMYMY